MIVESGPRERGSRFAFHAWSQSRSRGRSLCPLISSSACRSNPRHGSDRPHSCQFWPIWAPNLCTSPLHPAPQLDRGSAPTQYWIKRPGRGQAMTVSGGYGSSGGKHPERAPEIRRPVKQTSDSTASGPCQTPSRAIVRLAVQAVAVIEDQTGMPRRARSSGTTFNVGSCEQAMNGA